MNLVSAVWTIPDKEVIDFLAEILRFDLRLIRQCQQDFPTTDVVTNQTTGQGVFLSTQCRCAYCV